MLRAVGDVPIRVEEIHHSANSTYGSDFFITYQELVNMLKVPVRMMMVNKMWGERIIMQVSYDDYSTLYSTHFVKIKVFESPSITAIANFFGVVGFSSIPRISHGL